MSLLVTVLPIGLWIQVLSIFINPSPSPFGTIDCRDLRAVRSLSQTCRDLRALCSPLWYAEAKNRDTWYSEITFNNLLLNAASHGHIEVLQQAVNAGFAPGDPHSGLFRFQLDSTGRMRTWTTWNQRVNSARIYLGNLAQVSVLGVAAPHQKLSFLRWLFNLEVPSGIWTVRTCQPSLLYSAAEAGELEVIQYLLHIFPPQNPFVDSPSTLFYGALWNKAPNDTLEYLLGRVELTGYDACDWLRAVIERTDPQGLDFLLAHDRALRICDKWTMRDMIGKALDAVLLPKRRKKICSRSIEILNTVLRWSAGRWPSGSERRIHYNITNFTGALRWAPPRKQRVLLHIAKTLTHYYRVIWTQATEAGDEPWSFAFLENCACGRRVRLEGNWVKLFKLLYRRTPQGVCRAFASRYGPGDRAGPLRLVADFMFSDSFERFGFCACRRRILDIILGRGGSDINEGRGTALGTTLHTFCENVFRLQSRGYFECGPMYEMGSPREMLPFLTFLVDNGCDVKARDIDGCTALDWLLEIEQNSREDVNTWEEIMHSGRWEHCNFMKKALFFWPTDETSRGSWDLLLRLFDPEGVVSLREMGYLGI